jgi:hypothetical protein
LQDIKWCYKNSKKYYNLLISKYKNIPNWPEIYKKKLIGNKNCQNDIKNLKINKTIMNNPQEIANSLNDYFFTVADTVFGKIRKITLIL